MERTRLVDGEPRLVGSRCGACGHSTFPRRERCPACRAAPPEEVELGPDGVVLSSVELFVSTEEVDAPYTLGLVRLEGGVTLLARVSGPAEPGAPVQLAFDDADGAFWFAAVAHAGGPATPHDERTPDGGDPR